VTIFEGAGVVAAIVVLVVFVGQYTVYSPWWKDQIGRTLVALDIALLLALASTAASVLFGFRRSTSHYAAFVSGIELWLIAGVIMWRIVVWYRIYRQRRKS
jgi:hypothetical protein